MRIAFIYTPAHNFSVICPFDSYQNFGDPGQKTCFMYIPGQRHYPYLYTPTDEDSVHLYITSGHNFSVICPCTILKSYDDLRTANLISFTSHDKASTLNTPICAFFVDVECSIIFIWPWTVSYHE